MIIFINCRITIAQVGNLWKKLVNIAEILELWNLQCYCSENCIIPVIAPVNYKGKVVVVKIRCLKISLRGWFSFCTRENSSDSIQCFYVKALSNCQFFLRDVIFIECDRNNFSVINGNYISDFAAVFEENIPLVFVFSWRKHVISGFYRYCLEVNRTWEPEKRVRRPCGTLGIIIFTGVNIMDISVGRNFQISVNLFVVNVFGIDRHTCQKY